MAKEVTKALFTRRGMAEAFGVVMMTITGWEQEGMPVHTRGARGRPSLYHLPTCIEWYADRKVRAHGGNTSGLSPQDQRALLDEKRREDLDLRIRIRKGELVEVDEASRDLSTVALATRARMRRIPDSEADKIIVAAGGLPARRPAVSKLLLRVIDDGLRELAAKADEIENPRASEGDAAS